MKQTTLATTGFEKHARPTKKAEFLARMETLVPWAEFCALIEPHFLNPFLDGMKVHIVTDSKTGLIHSASVTAANVHDCHEVPNLLHGNETRCYGDSAYRGKAQRERLREIAPKAKDFTNKHAYRNCSLTDADKETNRRKSSVRSKVVEHPFLTLKRLWGFAKTRYRGLAKNANRAFAMLAMIHLVKWGRPMTGAMTGEVRPACAGCGKFSCFYHLGALDF